MSTPTLPPIKTLVKDTTVRLTHYRKGELWYEVVGLPPAAYSGGFTGAFTFPVPVDDCGDATFPAQDKALLYMRYIRKHLAALQGEIDAVAAANPAPVEVAENGGV